MPKFTEAELEEIRANTERIEKERQAKKADKKKKNSDDDDKKSKSKVKAPSASLQKRLRVFTIMLVIAVISLLVWGVRLALSGLPIISTVLQR